MSESPLKKSIDSSNIKVKQSQSTILILFRELQGNVSKFDPLTNDAPSMNSSVPSPAKNTTLKKLTVKQQQFRSLRKGYLDSDQGIKIDWWSGSNSRKMVYNVLQPDALIRKFEVPGNSFKEESSEYVYRPKFKVKLSSGLTSKNQSIDIFAVLDESTPHQSDSKTSKFSPVRRPTVEKARKIVSF